MTKTADMYNLPAFSRHLSSRRYRGRDQHAGERSNDTHHHEPSVLVKLGRYGGTHAREVQRRASERVHDDPGDEPSDRVRKEDKRER